MSTSKPELAALMGKIDEFDSNTAIADPLLRFVKNLSVVFKHPGFLYPNLPVIQSSVRFWSGLRRILDLLLYSIKSPIYIKAI
jgi:hypothetical protein